MSNIDDLRKLLQDFLAPELRSLSIRLDSLEKRMESNHASVMFAIAQLAETAQLKERIAALETRTAQQSKQ